LVEPKVAVFAPAPVATLTVLAVASVEIPTVPVPESIVIAALVPVMFRAPVPDWIVVEDVELVEPRVTALTAAPVPMFKVVAWASLEILIAPVPDWIVRPPDPDWTAVEEVVVRDPRVTAFAAAPVPTFRVVAAASSEMPNEPVPLMISIVPLWLLIAIPPEPD